MAGDSTISYSDGSSRIERFYHADVSPGNQSVFDAATNIFSGSDLFAGAGPDSAVDM